VDYWHETKDRIATAFIVERDGTVYQCFDPRFWAYHIGAGSNDNDNQASIGIELASEGALIEKAGIRYKFNARRGNEVRRENEYDHGTEWRGFRYFDRYDEPQIQASIELVDYLLKLFPSIPRKTPKDWSNFLPDWKRFRGVVTHAHLRRDKSDLHPGFPLARIIDFCKLEAL
jgi:N-acetyl-anhydromuramyl-L-alanine amidase AmpD